jgi:sodium/bile acid cotransporter 7
MKAFLIQRWFLIGLAMAMAAGLLGSDSPRMGPVVGLADSHVIRYGVVAVVLFLMALPLEARAVWHTLKRPGPPLLGVAMNSVALPALTWFVVWLLGDRLLSRDMALGMLATSAIPCTLASAAVWTRRAGGNDAVSIVVTVVTNASCFLVTPFWILYLTGESARIDAAKMIQNLALFVVLPMVIAQAIRTARSIGRWATRHTVPLSTGAQIGILCIIYFASVQTAQRFQAAGGRPVVAELLVVTASVLVIHVTILVAGGLSARSLGMGRPDQIAVAIAGSQKTLAVGLQVCMEQGFNIVPVVAFHITQLLVDTLIVDRLRGAVSAQRPTSQAD